ncbi:nucleotide exchange factor GrpE [Haloarchaeobius iranensis]|uniref:Protein GrpE n=1 Tax=Haloarchaeobius iranensis TaxID=996166 RepID=A0A1G9V0D2_9EURY|nr:molecular chaperone GrpE [Haloarchaeobius iranensis]
MDEDEDTEQSTPEQGSAAADEPPESPPEEVEEPTDDAAVDEDGTADASAESDAQTPPEEPGPEGAHAAADEAESEPDEGADAAASDERAQPAGSPVGEDLVERASQYEEELGAEVAALVERAFELKDDADDLRRRVDELEGEVEDLEDEREDLKQRLVRKQADFKNYKERSKKKQDQIRERATEDLVERLLPVRDNLTRALDQKGEDADIREGVEATLRDFDRVLEDENVEEVVPSAGDEVDPQRHEVMVRVDSELPEGEIVDVYRPGYEMADKVIQTAQVTVSNGADHEPDEAVALGGEVEQDDASEESTDDASEASADEGTGSADDEKAPAEEEAAAGDNRH